MRRLIKSLIYATLMSLLIGFLIGCGPTVVVKKPPPPRTEVRPEKPFAGAVWIPGHWNWSAAARDYVWVSGHWAKDRPGKRWVSGHWKKGPRGWVWVKGHWR